MKKLKISLLVLLPIFLLGSVALAQSKSSVSAKGFGLRTGYGTNPDQFVIGAQAVLGRTLGFMRFAPSIDAGFGNDMTTYLVNADFRLLSLTPPGSPAGLYCGAGLSLAVLDSNNAGSDIQIGVNVVTGLTFPLGSRSEYNLEVRFGLVDMPELRILFGIMLGSRSKSSSRAIEIGR
jgi:hypothetical protein